MSSPATGMRFNARDIRPRRLYIRSPQFAVTVLCAARRVRREMLRLGYPSTIRDAVQRAHRLIIFTHVRE